MRYKSSKLFKFFWDNLYHNLNLVRTGTFQYIKLRVYYKFYFIAFSMNDYKPPNKNDHRECCKQIQMEEDKSTQIYLKANDLSPTCKNRSQICLF